MRLDEQGLELRRIGNRAAEAQAALKGWKCTLWVLLTIEQAHTISDQKTPNNDLCRQDGYEMDVLENMTGPSRFIYKI